MYRKLTASRVAASLLMVANLSMPTASGNELATGGSAKSNGPVSVGIRKPECFNGKTRDEVLQLRQKAIDANSNFLLFRYRPNMEVFGRVEDKKPWWGLAGEAVYGKGSKSPTGLSEESRFILNPYLLVGADSATSGIWNQAKIQPADLNNPDFPFAWLPEQLQIDLRNKRGSVAYNVSSFIQAINKTGKLMAEEKPNGFSLIAYNARDFGYRYLFIDPNQSKNIVNSENVQNPVFIPQMLHCGGSCGYPGGCNNMSPFVAEIDRLHLSRLPATAVVKLWKDRPFSADQDPDFVFTLDFK